MTRRSDTDARLAELYAQIPEMDGCTGQCWVSCGPIDMSWRERQRIRHAGIRITPVMEAISADEVFACEALTAGNRCAVYELRPLICRLWGTAEGLECPFGCLPVGGYLTRGQARMLIAASLDIGGHETAGRAAELMARLSDPDADGPLGDWQELRGMVADQKRAQRALPPGLQAGLAETAIRVARAAQRQVDDAARRNLADQARRRR